MSFVLPHAVRTARPDRPIRVTAEVQSTAFRITRLTFTATAAYLLALAVLPAGIPAPLLAPLTALLVVQYSVYQTIKASVSRVVAVASGVLVAVLSAGTVGFSWWSLGLTILAALAVGHVLRLGEHVLEVPISAMLIFALGAASDAAAADRVLETLIGAGAGLAVTLLVPSVRVRPAQEAVEGVGAKLASVLTGLAADIRHGLTAEAADRRLHGTEDLARHIDGLHVELGETEDSLRLNPRAIRMTHAGIALRDGLVTMEHFTLSLRGLLRALADYTRLGGDASRLGSDDAVRVPLADMIGAIGAAVDTYGRLVCSDLAPDARPDDLERSLDRYLREAREHRARLGAAVRTRPGTTGPWPLYGEIIMHLDRLVEQLRVERRAMAREDWRRRRAAVRHLPERPARLVETAGARLRSAAERHAHEVDLGEVPYRPQLRRRR
ncbi:FUSC family protein [Actinomadura kijaniata]|uniref:FUSC family protein n=1 Tax=Actinomadura kijaniata TaxID=46161 RepID=UPI003F1D5388